MRIGIPKEIAPHERRVAAVPDTVGRMVNAEMEVLVESGAGEAASFSDEMYKEAGGTLVPDASSLMGKAEVVLKVQAPGMNDALGKHEVDMMAEGATIIALLQPLTNLDLVQRLVDKGITSFSMDTVPRIARAQSMDALSSMSSIAGYKAALMAASTLGKYFPMMMTAAGTYPPARGLVLGAGVAGLQAIATARRLGAVMQAFDVRPAVKQEVESLGATFVGITPQGVEVQDTGGYAKELAEDTQRQEREMIHRHTRDADFVITTALVPGRPAPLLITEDMVKDMKPGSIIVDLAAEAGGNCELTVPGAEVVKHGVTILGYLNLPSTMPIHASQMYSRNIYTLLLHLVKDKQLHLDFDDPITKGCCITHQGNVVYGPTQTLLGKGVR